MPRVFLDANVYFAGCVSPTGASALILQLARKGRLQIVASRLVLREADRNLRKKGRHGSLKAFQAFLRAVPVQVIPSPGERQLARYEAAVHPKDVPVLAAAVASRADYFITLDRKHLLTPTARKSASSLPILTPGEFIQRLLRLPHPGAQ